MDILVEGEESNIGYLDATTEPDTTKKPDDIGHDHRILV